jgi:hypothetical protein
MNAESTIANRGVFTAVQTRHPACEGQRLWMLDAPTACYGSEITRPSGRLEETIAAFRDV